MGLNVNMPDKLFSLIDDKEIEDLFRESLEAGSNNLNAETRRSLAAVTRSDLSAKVSSSKAKKAKNGAYILNSYPKGKTRDGKRATDAAFYLNYGTSHQPARPWVDRAIHNAEPGCLEAIEKHYNEWLNKKASEGWCDVK